MLCTNEGLYCFSFQLGNGELKEHMLQPFAAETLFSCSILTWFLGFELR